MRLYEGLIIVSMTSWVKRIGNVRTVLESLLHQELKADFIELNLSVLDFQDKDGDLPQDLIDFINENDSIEINWVDDNPGVFKKIIPTLKKFQGREYYLLSVDDDWIYRSDYINIMVKYLEEFKADTFCLSNAMVIGNRQIYKSSCFKSDFWENLTQEVIDTRIDDMYIEYYLSSKHKIFSNFKPENVLEITKPYNQVFPNSHNTKTGQYNIEEILKAKDIISKIKFGDNA